VGDVEVERRDEWAIPGSGNFYGHRLTNSSISSSTQSRLQDTAEVDLRATIVSRDVALLATKPCYLRSQNL
jgi:hypothetical protein